MEGSSHTRRRLLAGLSAVGVAALGGCVTTGLSLSADGVDESEVFDSLSLSESWTANKAVVKVTLTDTATTQQNVRKVAIIDAKGSSVWSDTVDPGQTSVSGARFPVGQTATLAASDHNDAFVDSVSVTLSGSSIP
ncbi:hypothetical protein C474_10486 [Halogeometricum pallidum JCM 14848]|uniref:Uncharacterized protein n=1 Tax=Halogeometricum pallidum JCM 14848 TaxID=1227487 RepID=M0D861_HALPD|nr:hypothetical protein [Halogeometricum pallidum]ELZ30882.1 hypothetical protein C474_10486 [Halogeometricum pallidum JCM 14848]